MIRRFQAAFRWRWARLCLQAQPLRLWFGALRARWWRPVAAWLCRHGLNTVYWFLKPERDSWERRMGYRNLKAYYDMGCANHKALMAAGSPEERIGLYQKMYDDAFGFLEAHFGLQTFGLGFDERMLAEHIEVFRGREVLDYGCGFGQSTAYLSPHARRVVGLDASEVCIDLARKTYGHLANIEFIAHQRAGLPFADESLDAAYSNDLFEHLHPEDGLRHLQEIRRILRKGGQYLLWTPPAEQGPSDGTKWFFPTGCGFKPICGHLKEYTPDELAAVVREAGFTRIDYPRPGQRTLVLMTK